MTRAAPPSRLADAVEAVAEALHQLGTAHAIGSETGHGHGGLEILSYQVGQCAAAFERIATALEVYVESHCERPP